MRALAFVLAAALVSASAAVSVASCRSSDAASPDPAVGGGAEADVGAGPPADAAAADAAFVCRLPPSTALTPKRPLNILMLTKETTYIHAAAHDAGEATIPAALRARGHTVTVTNDTSLFTPESLAPFDELVYFITSGRVLTDPQRAALLAFLHAGKGMAGAHTAIATDNDWVDNGRNIMDTLWGATFLGHGLGTAGITEAGLVPDDASPLSSFLPAPWVREDEWYHYFYGSPAKRPSVHTLVGLDESWLEPYRSDGGGNPAGWYPEWGFYGDAGHAISWTNDFECARIFYTAMGHTGESWSDDLVIRHFVAGVEWAGAPVTAR